MASKNPSSTSTASHEKQRSTGINGRGISTRAKIIDEARRQITTNGLKATTAATIAAGVNIPRPLFYHYFRNLDELAEEILDEIVNSFIDQLKQWYAQSSHETLDESLDHIIALWRTAHDDSGAFSDQLARSGNAAMYASFIVHIGDKFARFLTDNVIPEFASRVEEPITHVYETLFSLVIGINELMRIRPDFSNDEIKHMVVQALRFEPLVTSEHRSGENA